MAYRKPRTRRSTARRSAVSRKAVARRSSRKVNRPWSSEEVAFMRKYYRKYETAWCARQLGRSVYSVRYKAVDLSLKKANPSVWKGNKGPVNAFKSSGGSTRRPSRRVATPRRRSTRSRSWRANSARRTARKAAPRRRRRS